MLQLCVALCDILRGAAMGIRVSICNFFPDQLSLPYMHSDHVNVIYVHMLKVDFSLLLLVLKADYIFFSNYEIEDDFVKL